MLSWLFVMDIRYMSSCYLCCVFFFKQKTAYEMRISDWSSDVCSSDLKIEQRRLLAVVGTGGITRRGADALIPFLDKGLVVEFLVRRIAPEFLAYAFMHAFGEGFRQPVGQRLQDRKSKRLNSRP